MSASTSAASASSASVAPGSSGFGKATVGNAGSGSCCSSTTIGAGIPACSKTRRAVAQAKRFGAVLARALQGAFGALLVTGLWGGLLAQLQVAIAGFTPVL